MIFPEGSHDKRRTVRSLSKGFSRIVFGAIERNPKLQIQIIPVGITYQDSSSYPFKVSLNYGTPILANDFYKSNLNHSDIKEIKDVISDQLKTLSVHIPLTEEYGKLIEKLSSANIDFTKVDEVNSMIQSNIIIKRDRRINLVKFLKPSVSYAAVTGTPEAFSFKILLNASQALNANTFPLSSGCALKKPKTVVFGLAG
jgi:1-acyl-sn-glycerol-3-phosphate acyltransferase